MIVKNEARCLARCLHSVEKVVDEIVLVDTGSTDDTIKIAQRFNTTISHFDWINDFSAARNFSLDQVSGDWVLVLDADEFASEALGREVRKFIQDRPAIGRLKIVSDFRRNGQKLRSQCFISRLFPRGAHFQGRIHEQVASPLPRINLQGELWHDGYLETQKFDRNSKLLLAELQREPDNAYLLYQLALEYTSVEQTEKALQYLQKASARMHPNDPFAPNVLVDLLYAVIALNQLDLGAEAIAKAEKKLEDFPDFYLVRGLFYMNLIRSQPAKYVQELPKIEQSFRRCLALGETEKYKSVHGAGTFLANYNLGVFYHVFGNASAAAQCFDAAAAQGYEPAAKMLEKIKQ